MGWNTGWELMQKHVIGLYDLLGDEFTPEICKVILKPYIDRDMDEGGKDYNYFSKDGKSEEEIVIRTLFPDFDASAPHKPDEWRIDDDLMELEVEHEIIAFANRFYKLIEDREYWRKE